MTNIRNDQIDQNKRVLAALKEHGDRLEVVREITHWAYFRTIAARTLFIEKSTMIGLRMAETTEPTQSKLAFGVKLLHVDVPTASTMDDITTRLADLAEQTGGEYDGWETRLIK